MLASLKTFVTTKNYLLLFCHRGEMAADYFENNYIKPWCRFQPYLVGILLGYILHCTKSKGVKIQKVSNFCDQR